MIFMPQFGVGHKRLVAVIGAVHCDFETGVVAKRDGRKVAFCALEHRHCDLLISAMRIHRALRWMYLQRTMHVQLGALKQLKTAAV